MKTVKQYLEEIEDPVIRERALHNLWKEYGHEWAKSLPAALARAFLWRKSPEGFDYWTEVHYQLCNKTHIV